MDKVIDSIIDEYLNQNNKVIPVSGKKFGKEELTNLIKAALEGWWTEGKWTAEFEKKLKNFLGVSHVLACNSGSSANLLAFAALCSHSLKEKRIKRGDEVITLAAGFPTTINPILQYGCVPVFLDIEVGSYGPKISDLEKALTQKTKAVFFAHTLGSPFNIKEVVKFCKKNNLWLIEDNCDALGSKYDGKYTGTFGDISTLSFYPAHHITTAEGGAVMTNDPKLEKIIRSIRDWGRHCWCPTGKDNSCNNRYKWKHGELPEGYDHKYVYGEIGYNLKISDLHSAIGVAQMDRLPEFIMARRKNFNLLYEKLSELEDFFILPKSLKEAEPSWFGFLLTIKDSRINREELLTFLDKNRIGTRLLFGGNITKQPYFTNNPDLKYRVIGDLKNTDIVMNQCFWVGVTPLIEKEDTDIIVQKIKQFILNKGLVQMENKAPMSTIEKD